MALFRRSCQISANQCEAETIANVNKHCKTRALGNDVVTYAISADQHSVSTFSMQMFKSQRRSCELSFLFPPRRQSPPGVACSQAITLQSNALLIELTYHGSNCGVCVLQELSLRETLNCVLTAIKILSGQG